MVVCDWENQMKWDRSPLHKDRRLIFCPKGVAFKKENPYSIFKEQRAGSEMVLPFFVYSFANHQLEIKYPPAKPGAL
jgi:hypothetical protein